MRKMSRNRYVDISSAWDRACWKSKWARSLWDLYVRSQFASDFLKLLDIRTDRTFCNSEWDQAGKSLWRIKP